MVENGHLTFVLSHHFIPNTCDIVKQTFPNALSFLLSFSTLQMKKEMVAIVPQVTTTRRVEKIFHLTFLWTIVFRRCS